MNKLKKLVNKEDLLKIFSLYSKQSWLIEKEDQLLELFLFCETAQKKQLIIQLLNDFHYLDQKVLNNYLSQIADFIINDSKFNEETTQVASITFDDEADSSQKVIDYVKMPLFRQGWYNVKLVNRFGATVKNYREGRKQIIFIDEFVGSGQTIIGRIKQLRNDIGKDFELKFCFIAGMDHGIKRIEEQGFEVFCPLRLPKGISDRFKDVELEAALNEMEKLEEKLAPSINGFNLSSYSFGFNRAEALYSLEGCEGNTPNSVFPIFWWPRDISDNKRDTLLTRFERGLQ
jgi:hypothetical protein